MQTNIKKMILPDYIFESSWEVCRKIGGIYTVLSTKARVLQSRFPDKIIFIGPDSGLPNPDFTEDSTLFSDWTKALNDDNHLHVKTGRWNIPGQPVVILVDYRPFFAERDILYYTMWERFGVDSTQAYGDYDESCIFAYATGLVIESFYRFYHLENNNVIAHFNEWMLGMGLLYLRKHLPEIATVFTTHATTVGRSIAGNDKPLYRYLTAYNGDRMAAELHVEAKHGIEKQAAIQADCFTTVSDITAVECKQLLGKAPDVVTPNGFEDDFVPVGKKYMQKRALARKTLLRVAEKLLGRMVNPCAFLLSIGGRYEYRNKGIDVFIEVMNSLRRSDLQRETIAFIMVPAWVDDARTDLKEALATDADSQKPLPEPFFTHRLHNMDEDRILNFIRQSGFTNHTPDKLNIFFVPCYLDGNDGIFNLPYYDLLTGMDATVFPSYYEPWGYTPLESIAFGIPTVTTDLAGFGLWARRFISGNPANDGVAVIRRTDDNYFELVDAIADVLSAWMERTAGEQNLIRKQCFDIAAQAQWERFITCYYEAYDIALAKRNKRNK
jgi:glycosyltransferase involved in cell wall biosynthesis